MHRLRSIRLRDLIFTLGAVLVTAAGCTRKGFLAVPKADDTVIGQVGSFTADTHFLLEPLGDPEALLGRAVQISSNGGWTIADARAPGCEVETRRSPAEYDKHYEVALDDMTTLAAGYRDLLGLSARYGRSVHAEYSVQNKEILRADTRGSCGDVIVSSVRVGAGKRTLLRSASGEIRGSGGQAGIGAHAGRSGDAKQLDVIQWSTPQAYAFTFERNEHQAQSLDLEINAPMLVQEGQTFALEISASQPVTLIVLYLEEDGPGGVLWPSPDLPLPKIDGGSLLLPPTGAVPLIAALREPGMRALETLVIFAFTDEADFKRLRPKGAVVGADYAARLSQELSTIPLSRWARTTHSYVIEPNADPS